MDHFEFQVGAARVRVHQALGTDTPFIRIECGGEEKTLTLVAPVPIQQVEIKLED